MTYRDPPCDPDQRLIHAIHAARPEKRGALFAELHARHRERIQALCQRLTRNEADAQDALQETFLAAHRQIETFRGEARFSTWLHRVAFNKCGEIRRRRQRRQRHEGEAASHQVEDRNRQVVNRRSQPDAWAEDREQAWRVRQALKALPGRQREAVELRYFASLPYEEIATILHVPVGTVKSRLYRAHRALARDLEQDSIPA